MRQCPYPAIIYYGILILTRGPHAGILILTVDCKEFISIEIRNEPVTWPNASGRIVRAEVVKEFSRPVAPTRAVPSHPDSQKVTWLGAGRVSSVIVEDVAGDREPPMCHERSTQ